MTYEIEAEAFGTRISCSGDEADDVVDMFRQLLEGQDVDFPALNAPDRIKEQ